VETCKTHLRRSHSKRLRESQRKHGSENLVHDLLVRLLERCARDVRALAVKPSLAHLAPWHKGWPDASSLIHCSMTTLEL
jgi:hypothetical protein